MSLEANDKDGWLALSYALVMTVLTLFAAYAVLYTRVFSQRSDKEKDANANLEGFISASHTQGKWRIGWSFYAGSVGAWCITGPPGYATFAGWIGMVFYALATGIPIIAIAFFGQTVQDKYPTARSFGDFVSFRFGPTARVMMEIVALFNMSIFMLAEFTTIGGLFKDFVGSVSYPIIIVVAVLTTGYTAYGGLLVSIVTDQVQAGLSILILAIATIYVAVNFDQPLPDNFGIYEESLGPNKSGYSAILTMPMSLMSATVFNEGMWQRVWAAEDSRALKQGGCIAAVAIVTAVFLYGFFGFLAAWGGMIDFDTANPNLYLFQIFNDQPGDGNATVNNWISVLVLVLAATMNQSAIDSLQNGITATLSSHFLKGQPIYFARGCVVLISIPICVVALQNPNVLSIFLVGNMLGSCCFLPILIGGVWSSEQGRRFINESNLVYSCITAILVVTAFGIGKFWNPDDVGNSISVGADYTWYSNPYEWEYFAVAAGTSLIALFVYGSIAELMFQNGIQGVGITDILSNIPGFTVCAGAKQHIDPVDYQTAETAVQKEKDVSIAVPELVGR